jgi:ABC-2 type transport system permease protein
MYFLIKLIIRKFRERKLAQSGSSAGGSETPAGDADPSGAAALASSPAPRTPAVPRPSGPSAASRGPVVRLGHQIKFDLLAGLRNPRARFFTFFFPIVLLVVFNGVFGHGTAVVDGVRVKLSRFYVPGILTMALVVISRVLYGVGFSGPAILAIAVTAAIGTIAFACIGYLVSNLIGSPDAAQPLVQATMLPLWFVSGVFIPTSNLSSGLRKVGEVFPVEHLANGMHVASVHSTFSSAISPTDLGVLAVWGVGAGLLAAWRSSWLPSAATA